MTKIQRGAVLRTAGAYDELASGTVTAVAANSTALASSPTRIIELVVQNDPASANSITVGPANRQDVVIVAGASITIPINDLSRVYVRGVGGNATVNWIAVR